MKCIDVFDSPSFSLFSSKQLDNYAKEGKIPSITENKYINKIPITKVGKETPSNELISIKLLTKPSRFIAV